MASVVLDASVLIALYSSKDRNHAWAMDFFKQTLDRDLKMTVLNFSECLAHPVRAGKLQRFNAGIAGLGIEIVGLEPLAGPELAKLRAETGLKMPDVLVLFEALKSNAALASTDSQVSNTAREMSLEVFSPSG